MNNLLFIFKEVVYLGITASILTLMILLIKKIFSKALSPKWHYYIWILLLIRLLIPFSPESSMSIYSLVYTAAEKVNLPINEISISFQGNSLNEPSSDTLSPLPNVPEDGDNNINTKPSKVLITNTNSSLEVNSVSKYDSIITILAFIWMIGVILLSLYTICINISFYLNVRKRYTVLMDKRLNDILKDCKNIMKINHPISLLTSRKIRTPSLYGLLNTKILVSEAYMNKLSDDEIRYIFLHELSHYKRKDILINWIMAILQIIYFFNPFIWYAFYKIHEDCEISCDAAALTYIGETEYKNYGNTIIKLIKLFSESTFIPLTAGISKNKSSYKRRIIMISKFKRSKWTSTLLALVLMFSVGLIGLTGCNLTEDKTANTNITDSSNDKDNNKDINKDNEVDPTKNDSSTSEPSESKEVFYGEWVIQKVLAYGSAGTYSTESAESLLGKNLIFSEDKASNFGDEPSAISKIATNPIYKKTLVSKDEFITNYRMSLDKLGISSDSASEITVSDSKGTVSTFFIKDDNTLIIYGGGTYFELLRKTK